MDKPPYQVNLDMITFTSNLGTFCTFISFLLRVLISEKAPGAFSTSILLQFNLGQHWKKWWSNLTFAPECFTILETIHLQKIFRFILGCLESKIFHYPPCESIIITVLNSNTVYVLKILYFTSLIPEPLWKY